MLRVPYGLSVYDEREINAVVKVLKDHRSNMGIETAQFEEKIAKIMGKKYGVMVNSGSSALMIAIELLNFPKGSEIITPVLTFSTTVSPIIKNGLVPIFTDVLPGKYILDVDQVKHLISKKTRALMVPLLLGNIPEMDRLLKIAKKHNLVLIEDSCDTLGGKYKGKLTGEYSNISITSFFGSHIITAGGNGGMLLVDDKRLRDRAKLLRGWGRTSSILSESEVIEKRFKNKIEGVEYDAKFTFEEIGYNLLPSEMGAAFGNIQLTKLLKFRKARENNFERLLKFFKKYTNFFTLPIQEKDVETQWLAFPLTIKKTAPFTRLKLVKYLEEKNIQTRPIFTGNITKQPGFKKALSNTNGKFPVADDIMKNGFVIGCHHGIGKKHLDKIEDVFTAFLNKYL